MGREIEMSAEELLRTVSDKDVRAFLLGILREDDHYATLFCNTYGPLDLETACQALDNEIHQEVWRHADRHGFIEYRNASDFGWSWTRALGTAADPLLERGEREAVVTLVLQALKSVWGVEMDDSDGIVENMLLDMRDYFERVLDQAGEAFESRFIEIVCDFLCSPPAKGLEREMFGYQQEAAEKFLFKRFGSDERHAGQLARYAKAQLQHAKADCEATLKKKGAKSWDIRHAESVVGSWMMRLLQARKIEGASVPELVEIAGDDVTNEGVCIMLQAEARAQGDERLARDLLERTKRAHLNKGDTYPLRVSERLAELLGEDDVEALRDELLYQMNFKEGFRELSRVPALWPRLRATYDAEEWELVRDAWAERLTGTWARLEALESDRRYDELMNEAEKAGIDGLRHFETTLSERYPERMLRAYLASRVSYPALTDRLWDQVKAACPREAWPELARELVSLMQDPGRRMERLAKEGMYEDLMAEVEKAGIKALPAYRAELAKRYPDRVLQMLADDLVSGDHLRSATRKAYAEFCDQVIALRDLPGGEEAAARVIEETKRRYPNRKALHDELERAQD